RLVLDFNEGVTEGVGQVASTVNVENLSVVSGAWRADGPLSFYGGVEIAEGAALTLVENADGFTPIGAPVYAVDGQLKFDFATDTGPGAFTGFEIQGAGSLHIVGEARLLFDSVSPLKHSGGTFVESGTVVLTTSYGGNITTSGDGVFELAAGGD